MVTRSITKRVRRVEGISRRGRAKRRLHLEALEERIVLSSLIWENQGSSNPNADNFDEDNFNTAYGGNADLARAVVVQALNMWEDVMDFLVGAPDNEWIFEIEADDLGPCTRGSTDMGVDGASITMDDDAAGCMGGAQFWYFDPNPGDSVEYPNISDPDRATGGPAGWDYLSTVLHEIGHGLGISQMGAIDSLLMDVGTDQVDNSSDLYLLLDSSMNPLMTFTDAGGLHVYEGPPDPNFPNVPTNNNDLMNAGRTTSPGLRRLISDLDGQIFVAGYGDTVTRPSCLANQSYQAQLDSVLGVLTINGEINPSSVNDQIILKQITLNNTDFISVQVTNCDIIFPSSAVTQIVVQPTVVTDGDDTITIDLSSENWIPMGGITVNAGSGTNTLLIKGPPGANNTYTITGSQVVLGGSLGSINYSNIADMTVSAEPTSTNNTMNVSATGALQNLTVVGSDNDDDITVTGTSNALQKLQIDALDGPDTIVIEALTSVLEIDTGGGNNLVQFAPAGGDLDTMPAAKAMSIDGTLGNDLLVLNDFNETNNQFYSFLVDFSMFPAGEGSIVRGGFTFFFHLLVEQVILNAGSGNDDFSVQGTPVGSDLTLFAADGEDEFEVGTNAMVPNVGDVHSHVHLHGGNGTNTAVLDDRSDNTGDIVTVTETTVGAGPADTYLGFGGSLEYHALDDLTIYTSQGTDIINVESTAVGTDTTINASRGNDQITVTGPPDQGGGKGKGKGQGKGKAFGRREGTADEIKSILTVNGEIGINTLTVIDTSDTTTDIMTLTDMTIGMGSTDTFLGTGGGIVYSSIFTLSMLMGSGGNDAFVESTHVVTDTVFLKTGEGPDTVLVQNPAGNVNDIRSTLDVDGQDGTDSATTDDGAEPAASTLTVTPGQVLGDGTYFGTGGELTYAGLELLIVQAGLAGDTAFVTGTNPGTETHLNTGGGIDLVTVSAGGTVDLVRSLLAIDGEAMGAAVALLDGTDPTQDQVSITDSTVGAQAGDNFFGSGGSLSYTNFVQLNLLAGLSHDLINVLSTHFLTGLLIGGGGGDDLFRVDSNGADPGGTVDAITSQVQIFGGLGTNGLIFDDTDDPTGDVVSVRPTGANAGNVGAGPTDTFFGIGGVVEYNEMAVVGVRASNRADTVNASPAPTLSGTLISFLGGSPTPLDPAPLDVLNLDLTGVGMPTLSLLDLGIGQLSSSTHASLFYGGMEVIDEVAGNRYDLVVDMNAGNLPGNDGGGDLVEAQSGQFSGSKTLDLQINSNPAFTGYESAINSLNVIGSGDDDTFLINETADGLPNLPGDPDGNPLTDPGHTNAAFAASGRTPTNISIHFDGGAGAAIDRFEVFLITPQDVAKFDDVVGPAKSGVVNVDTEFTMSYVNLEPVRFDGAGGTVEIDPSSLRDLTTLTMTTLADGSIEIRGDGGFETTIAKGFDRVLVHPPEGVRVIMTELRSASAPLLSSGLADDGIEDSTHRPVDPYAPHGATHNATPMTGRDTTGKLVALGHWTPAAEAVDLALNDLMADALTEDLLAVLAG